MNHVKQLRADRDEAYAALNNAPDALIQRLADTLGRSPKKVREELRVMAHAEPLRLVRALEAAR